MEKKHDEAEIKLLTERMTVKSPVLVLGAGFSLGAKNGDGKELPLAPKLAEELFDKLIHNNSKINAEDKSQYEREKTDLRKTCDNLRMEHLQKERDTYLTKRLSNCHCSPDDYHMLIREYPWRYIFTLNIDDLVEYIYSTLQKKNQPLVHVMTSSSLDSESSLELLKPHGSVKRIDLGYVFDSEEYQNLMISSSWIMRIFSDLFLTNDVVFLGTEFQEEDFHLMIRSCLKLIDIKQPYHYFFVSPSLNNRELQRNIKGLKHLHYIPWTTEKFLRYIKKSITSVSDIRRKMRDYGMTFYDEKQQEAVPEMSHYLSELYIGSPPRPIDFFKDMDIVRPELKNKADDIAAKGGCQLIIFSGYAYVGKTCAAIRMGVDLMAHGYDFSVFGLSYSVKADSYERLIMEYLHSLPDGRKVAILSESMAYYYDHVRRILDNCPDNIASLILICTTSVQDHSTKRYLLDQFSASEVIYISEKTNKKNMAEAIYDKLETNNHLNRLRFYGETRKECIKFIQETNDLIEVLYISQEGRGFVSHFSDWIEQQQNSVETEGLLLLSCLSELGFPGLTKPLFRDILFRCGIQIDVLSFLKKFTDLVQIENDRLRLRCPRLLWASAQNQLKNDNIFRWLDAIIKLFGKNLREREETLQNEMFQKAIKIKALRELLSLPLKDVMVFLLEEEETCKHLSYYWVQRGICHRELEQFEEANNALLEASKIRNNTSFQIKHALAKNYMAWGVWAISKQPNFAIYYFDTGKSMLEELILDAPHRYFAYSVHTYVDMILRYHQKAGNSINENELTYISILLQRLLSDFDETMTYQIIDKFLKFCDKAENELVALKDLQSMYYLRNGVRKTYTLPELSLDSDEITD